MPDPQPVPLKDAKKGDHVLFRYRRKLRGDVVHENWWLVEVTARTPRFITARGTKFDVSGESVQDFKYTLCDPTPENVALYEASDRKRAEERETRRKEEEARIVEENANAVRACEWLVANSVDKILMTLPRSTLSDIWITIQAVEEQKDGAVR